MADYSKYYEAREVVTRILEQDFIGPVTKDECLAEVPVQYYIMGKLYPQKDTVEALDLARNPLLENEIETYDVSISLSNQNNPSSMGITVTLKVDVSAICVSGSYAFYEPTSFDDAKECGIDTSRWEHLERSPKKSGNATSILMTKKSYLLANGWSTQTYPTDSSYRFIHTLLWIPVSV